MKWNIQRFFSKNPTKHDVIAIEKEIALRLTETSELSEIIVSNETLANRYPKLWSFSKLYWALRSNFPQHNHEDLKEIAWEHSKVSLQDFSMSIGETQLLGRLIRPGVRQSIEQERINEQEQAIAVEQKQVETFVKVFLQPYVKGKVTEQEALNHKPLMEQLKQLPFQHLSVDEIRVHAIKSYYETSVLGFYHANKNRLPTEHTHEQVMNIVQHFGKATQLIDAIDWGLKYDFPKYHVSGVKEKIRVVYNKLLKYSPKPIF